MRHIFLLQLTIDTPEPMGLLGTVESVVDASTARDAIQNGLDDLSGSPEVTGLMVLGQVDLEYPEVDWAARAE